MWEMTIAIISKAACTFHDGIITCTQQTEMLISSSIVACSQLQELGEVGHIKEGWNACQHGSCIQCDYESAEVMIMISLLISCQLILMWADNQ